MSEVAQRSIARRGGFGGYVSAERHVAESLRLGSDEMTWSSPAVTNEALHVRTADHLFGIRE
jgi:hypothetical protein